MTPLTFQALVLTLLLACAKAYTRGALVYSQKYLRGLQTVTGWNQIGQDINGEAATDQSGWAVAISDDGNRVLVSSPQNDVGGANAGSVRLFQYQSNAWAQLGPPIRGVAGESIGQAVTISGDGSTVVVSSTRLAPFTGFIRVYRFENNAWRLLAKIDGKGDRDQFGGSVSLNYAGTRLAAGASYHGSSRGSTEIWEQSSADTVWNLIGTIDGATNGDRSGHACALSSDGTTVVVGEIAADPSNTLENAGTTAVYKRTSSLAGWDQLGSDIPGSTKGDQSGYSVSISEDGMIVAIGSPMHSSQTTQGGMARVYSYDASQDKWVQLGSNILPETPGQNAKFGYSVSLSSDGKILVVGEPSDTGTGKASIFYYRSDSNNWSRDIALSEGAAADRYGYAVALSGDSTRLAVGAYGADQSGSDRGKTRVYEFQTSAWLLNVENFEATFATGTTSEFTITYKGIAPAAGNGRTFRLTMLLPSCALGAASSAAISPVAASGTVPASAAFRLASKLDVNMDTIRDSGYYSDSGVGKSNIAFCAKMEILEGAEVKVDRLADINVELDMGQEFQVTDFISRDPTTGKTEVRDATQFNYGFSYFFCDDFGTALGGNVGKSVPPGGKVSVCLEADANEPVMVDNVKAVSFQNSLAPLLGVPLIDDEGSPLGPTTVKDCSDGVCRIAAVTVPRLYEYVDSSGNVRDVTAGVSMEGTIAFAFPTRRLQGDEERLETTFRVRLNLAKPPDRTGSRQASSAASCVPASVMALSWAAVAVCFLS